MRRQHRHIHAGVQLGHIAALLQNHAAVGHPVRFHQPLRIDRVRLLFFGNTYDQEADLWKLPGDTPGHGEELLVPLLAHQPGDDPHHQMSLLQSQFAPLLPPRVQKATPVEAPLVDPIADQMQSLRLLVSAPASVLVILGALKEQVVAPAGAPALGRGSRQPVQPPAVFVEQKSVDRMHHQGHARQPRRQRPDQRALGIVGVGDVEALPPQRSAQRPHAAPVGARRDLPGKRDVQHPQTALFQPFPVADVPADHAHLELRLLQPQQPDPEQQIRNPIGRHNMGDAHSVHTPQTPA